MSLSHRVLPSVLLVRLVRLVLARVPLVSLARPVQPPSAVHWVRSPLLVQARVLRGALGTLLAECSNSQFVFVALTSSLPVHQSCRRLWQDWWRVHVPFLPGGHLLKECEQHFVPAMPFK